MRTNLFIGIILAIAPASGQNTDQPFVKLCAVCHGAEGTGGDRGPSLAGHGHTRSAAEIRALIRNGTPGGMPSFDLPDAQLDALTGFVRSLNLQQSFRDGA